MNHKLWIALLVCSVLLVPVVFAAAQRAAPPTKDELDTRLAAAKLEWTKLKADAVKARLTRILPTTTTINSMTDEQLADAVQSVVATKLSAWKTVWNTKRNAVTPAVAKVIKHRLVQAQKALFWKQIKEDWANKPVLAEACKDEIAAAKVLASEAAMPAVAVQNVDEATADDQTTVAGIDPVKDLNQAKEVRHDLVKCLAQNRFANAFETAKAKVAARKQFHEEMAPKIDAAIAKLDALIALRDSDSLSGNLVPFKEFLVKLKTLNSGFIANADVLLAKNPTTPKEKVQLLRQMNKYVSESHQFQGLLKRTLRWFVKLHNAYNKRVPLPTDVTEAQTGLTVNNTELGQIKTDLTATIEQPPIVSDDDKVAQVLTEAENNNSEGSE